MSRFLCLITLMSSLLMGAVAYAAERVVIYTSAEEYRNAYFEERLKKAFPQYEIILDYMPTGNQAAKLMSEGKNTPCDISLDLEYAYLEQLQDNLAVLDQFDFSIYTDDFVTPTRKWLPVYRNGGAIIVNTQVLKAKGLAEPQSYADLLKPEYKNLISMPNPKFSGTGYMFIKNLVNIWGEDKALDYFDDFSKNVLQFTSSGSGPVKALVQGEAAIGLGMTGQAVIEINKGSPLKVTYFEEGSPYTLYGMAIIAGKEKRQAVQDVMKFFYDHLIEENNAKFFPEKVFKNKDFTLKNFPAKIQYANMGPNTIEEKKRILDNWEY